MIAEAVKQIADMSIEPNEWRDASYFYDNHGPKQEKVERHIPIGISEIHVTFRRQLIPVEVK